MSFDVNKLIEYENRGDPAWLAEQAAKNRSVLIADTVELPGKARTLSLVTEPGSPEGYDPSANQRDWMSYFYIAIYGGISGLKAVCQYIAQIAGPDGNLCPQFLWPDLKGTREAYLWINKEPRAWQIADAPPVSGGLPDFAEDGVTEYLADQKGPMTYCEGRLTARLCQMGLWRH